MQYIKFYEFILTPFQYTFKIALPPTFKPTHSLYSFSQVSLLKANSCLSVPVTYSSDLLPNPWGNGFQTASL